MATWLKRTPTGIRAHGPIEIVDPGHRVYGPVPVDSREIRLIKLQPAGSLSSPVVTKLIVAPLGDPSVHYDALSYAWGDGSDKRSIRVNGQPLVVTRSLDTALRYLRREGEEVVLWVDSICIDQGHVAERNVQVGNMGEIYRNAKVVRIWLGESADGTEAAMKLVDNCTGIQDDHVVKQILNNEDGAVGLAELLRRPYWGRMWMFQEIHLARVAHVHCGIFTAAFDTFIRMDKLAATSQHWPDRRTSPAWSIDLRKAFLEIAHFTLDPSELIDLEYVLMVTRSMEASEPRDKLFALTATCNMKPYLSIDYDIPVRDVYASFTRSYVRATGNLSLLLTAGCNNPAYQPGDEIVLPSWTPDFRGTRTRPDIHVTYGMARVFNASKGARFAPPADGSLQSEPDSGIFEVEGIILDTIEKTFLLARSEESMHGILGKLSPGASGCDPSGMPQLEALRDTMIFNTDNTAHGTSQGMGASRKDRLLQLTLGFMHDLELQLSAQGTQDRAAHLAASWESPTAKDRESPVSCYEQLRKSDPESLKIFRQAFVQECIRNAGTESSMFRTSGGYIGRGGHSVQQGDVVTVLFGADMPVLLRREGSYYKIIGPCYVRGVMFGEAMNRVGNGVGMERLMLI
ncbi:Heterokaryon incompatibility protein 6, OR allele 2 [Colletotrichum chlorophyti]|uniref:Heterokaryon incompatibility protein 6, OR allele 2 n=1 Tax=Colletotrichum chlorophyti TaxID=708187 RepID=A0A1Q8S620_9PEZI|nr:Heterokaryon incompatibility protein 6, OR allele 2 [Colletotrichum chlorophyti]